VIAYLQKLLATSEAFTVSVRRVGGGDRMWNRCGLIAVDEVGIVIDDGKPGGVRTIPWATISDVKVDE
jgi:hypothetical protein